MGRLEFEPAEGERPVSAPPSEIAGKFVSCTYLHARGSTHWHALRSGEAVEDPAFIRATALADALSIVEKIRDDLSAKGKPQHPGWANDIRDELLTAIASIQSEDRRYAVVDKVGFVEVLAEQLHEIGFGCNAHEYNDTADHELDARVIAENLW